MIFWLRHPDKSWTQLHRVLYAYEVVPNRPETRSVAVRRSTLGFFFSFRFRKPIQTAAVPTQFIDTDTNNNTTI